MKSMATWAFAFCLATLAVASEAGNDSGLTATQIVEKNTAARGGLEAWRKIQSMTWVGHVERANAQQPSLPFALEMKRPNKTRFEIKVQGQASVRMFDGTQGWRLRQTSPGKPEVQPYTPDELSFARDGQGMDGPLMDYQAKGNVITLEGMDELEGRRAYRLSVKLPSGTSQHVWVDAQTFLEIKYDRVAHGKFGQTGRVSVFYRNYKTVEGVQIPLMIESRAEDRNSAIDKMVIDRVLINPPLADRVFAYSGAMGHGKGAMGHGKAAAVGSGHSQSAKIPPLRNPARGITAHGGTSLPLQNAQGSDLERQ